MTINEQWKKTLGKIDALSLREKIILLIAILAGVYLIWDGIIVSNFFSGDANNVLKISTMKSTIKTMEDRVAAINELLKNNSFVELDNKIQDLKNKNDELNKQIKAIAGELVGPKEMVDIIKNLVQKVEGLTVVRIESVGTTPMFTLQKYDEESKEKPVQVYIHNVAIELTGGYFDTLAFLEMVEQRNLQLWWDELNYNVDAYPLAKIKILLHTLSLEEGFLGV